MPLDFYIDSQVSQTITDGVTDFAPSENAVFDALAQKLDTTALPSNLTLYYTDVASDIGGYFKAAVSLADPDYPDPAVDFTTAAVTTTAQLVASFATTAGVLSGNPGQLSNVILAADIKRDSGTGTATFYYEIYHRNNAGTETLIGTSDDTLAVSSGTYSLFQALLVWDNGTFLATDRIVVKAYANRIAGGSNPVFSFRLGGATPSRAIVPVPASVLLDVPIRVGTTVISNGTSGKVLYNNAGVLGEIAIDTTPTNGSANLIDSNAVYDALALKQNLLFRSVTVAPSTTLTGVLTEVELLQVTIPANTLSANEILHMMSDFVRSGVNNVATLRFKMSTSNTMPATTTGQFATWIAGTGQTSHKVRRRPKVYGGNLVGVTNTTSLVTDEGSINVGLSTQAFDPTVTNYFYISGTLSNASDTIYLLQNYLGN